MTSEQKETTDRETWTAWVARYIARLKVEAEGVQDLMGASRERKTTMDSSNPK